VGVKGGIDMNWDRPSFVEIKMDSEINSYQDDFQDIPDEKSEIISSITPSVSLPITRCISESNGYPGKG
jgi:hypothetical protein